MIERHVTFQVIGGKESEFEQFFRAEYLPAMSAQQGFIHAELFRELDQRQNYQMCLRFDSVDAAARWRESAEHKRLGPRLKSLYTMSSLIVYDVVAPA